MQRRGQAPRRWRALLWLTTAVLAVHVWLLGGDLWLSGPDRIHTADPQPMTGLTRPDTAGQPSSVAESRAHALPVTITQVRWTVPTVAAQLNEVPINPAPAPARLPLPAAADARPTPALEAAPSTRTAPMANDVAPAALAPAHNAPGTAEPLVDKVASDLPLLDSSAAERQPTPPSEDTLMAAAPATAPAGPTAGAPRPNLPPATSPGPAELVYEVSGRAKGLRYSADARLRWQPGGNRYTAELEVNAFLVGNRVQTSRGRLDAQGLSPERFGDKRRGKEKATHFDPVGQRIRYSSNAPDTPLQPGAQDRLSVFMQLASLFQARPTAYTAGQALRLQVAGTHDADTWTFQIGPEETLTLPAGTLQARRLTRPPQGEHDNTVDIWLAPELQYLPVRIRITEPDGDMADQKLRQRPP
jgi:hypothetical protein